jgi:hypothetical protein
VGATPRSLRVEAVTTTGRWEGKGMASIVKGLLWPVAALIVIGSTHLGAELVRPELHDLVGPAVAMPIYLVAGAWAAWGTARAAGTFVHGLAAAAILGILPAALQVVGFGLIAGRPADAVATAALFGWLGVLWGGVLGSGVAASSGTRSASR